METYGFRVVKHRFLFCPLHHSYADLIEQIQGNGDKYKRHQVGSDYHCRDSHDYKKGVLAVCLSSL